jgi:hypothetical protein
MVKKRSRVILLLGVLAIVIIILAFIIYIQFGSQSAMVSGVTEGDVFTYGIKGFWSSSDPNATLPENFLQINMTDWYKVTVTGVNGSQVSINTIWRFTNGTELVGTGNVNLETGISYGGFWAIYAANLRAGDHVRPNGPDRSTVNETNTKGYGAGGTRETNLLSLVRQYYDADDPTYGTTWTEYMSTYFDKQTGVLVELSDISLYTNPQMTLTLIWSIRDTNRWTVS